MYEEHPHSSSSTPKNIPIMKSVVVVIALIVVTQSSIVKEQENEDWTYFKTKFEKTYPTVEEELYRYNIYKDNKAHVVKHNSQRDTIYKVGINRFSDMTPAEIEAMTGTNVPNHFKDRTHIDFHVNTGNELPDNVDWRTKNAVTVVQDQKCCASGWAFSATGAIEGQTAIKMGKLVSLSEQNLIDCDTRSYGCDGGYITNAFEYVKENGGIDTEESYIYIAVDEGCAFKPSDVGAKVTGYKAIKEGSEDDLADAVANVGPISVGIDTVDLQHYKSGIFKGEYCVKDRIRHFVLIVGYGSENGVDYWIGKNSWGKAWGEDGYFKLLKDGTNVCNVASNAFYPTM